MYISHPLCLQLETVFRIFRSRRSHFGVTNTCWSGELSLLRVEPDQRISCSAGQALSLEQPLGVKVTGKGTEGKSHMWKMSNSVPTMTAGRPNGAILQSEYHVGPYQESELEGGKEESVPSCREDNWIHGRSTGAHFTRNHTTAHSSLKDNTGLQREPLRGVHFAIKGTTYSKWDTLLCLFFPATAGK